MSTIDFSEQDYASIKRAADAAGMPVGEWVVAHLPLEQSRTDAPSATPGAEPKADRTMAQRLAGRLGLVASNDDRHPNGQTLAERAAELGLVGVVNSGGAERLSERHSEVFGEMLEEQRKAGRP